MSYPLKVGDRIRLNETAREWTRGKVFTVYGIGRPGVVCWTEEVKFGEAHVVLPSGRAYYKAPWSQIEEPSHAH